MIEKNIRLQPHHARDLLVGRRSDGRRPGYQPPGHGSGGGRGRDPSPSGGGGGPPGGGDRGMTYSAPAPAPSPHRDEPVYVAPVTTAIAPPSILSRPTPKDTRGDTPERLKEQIILDEIQKKKKEQFEEDWGFEDLKRQALTVPPKRYRDVVVHHPEVDDVVPTEIRDLYSPTGYQDLSRATTGTMGERTWGEQAEAGIPRGGIMSAIGGGLKKVFGETPLEWVSTIASGGVLGPEARKIASTLKTIKRAKESALAKKFGLDKLNLSNLKPTTDKRRPSDMPEHLGERGFRTRAEHEPIERDGIQQAITGEKGLLTEGAETLGITDEQREQYMLMQNKMKMALDQGSYTNEQGQVIQLNEQQLDQLQTYIDNLNNILQTTLQRAHGGRIDSPLTGRSRYI